MLTLKFTVELAIFCVETNLASRPVTDIREPGAKFVMERLSFAGFGNIEIASLFLSTSSMEVTANLV